MIFRLDKDNTEVFTLETNPNREINVSQDGNITGSLYVIPRQQEGLKELNPSIMFTASFGGDMNAQNILDLAKASKDASYEITEYMTKVHSLSKIAKFNSTASVYMIKTPATYNQDAARRLLVQSLLERQPVKYSQESNWSTTNYNCINFFTSSNTPTNSALIYDNKDIIDKYYKAKINVPITGASDVYSYAKAYQLYDQFTIDFWIKPKYNADASELWSWPNTSPYYRPGAILHMSGAYSITIHSGSSIDKNNNPSDFKLCFCLGADAKVKPDEIEYNVDSYGTVTGSTFWSSSSIELNNWTHVAITYGGYSQNQGTGSIWINGVKDKEIPIGMFVPVGTGSVITGFEPPPAPTSPLYVGNFYENIPQQEIQTFGDSSSQYNQNRFYSNIFGDYENLGPGDFETRMQYYQKSIRHRKGLNFPSNIEDKEYYNSESESNLYSYDPQYLGLFPWDAPVGHIFRYPLNAELHDIRIWSKCLTKDKLNSIQKESTLKSDLVDLRFWVPPFFTEESIDRFNEPVTTFYQFGSHTDGFPVSSSVPIAGRLALSVNGFYPNLENYVTDLITDTPPVLWGLRWAQQITGSTADYTANRWLYEELDTSQDIKKRLYTIIPCDHGNYKPAFNLLQDCNFSTKSFVNEFGSKTLGRVNLKNLLYYTELSPETASTFDVEVNTSIVGLSSTEFLTRNAENFLLAFSDDVSSSIVNDIVKARPENTTAPEGFGYAIWQRLQSPDSHFITLFDISNLYYGESIKPGTVELCTSFMSGSDGAFGMKLRDNGRGGLYRADSDGNHAEWSTVGTVMYDEGIIIIKYPQLYFFGEMGWNLKFKGTRNVYVYTIEAMAVPLTCTESSDPMYNNIVLPEKVDYDPSEDDRKQVFISSILIHDENLNVIMRTNLAQPIVKKTSDKLLFKTKIDF